MDSKAASVLGYETVFVTRTDLPDPGLKALHDKVKNIIIQHEGEFVLSEDWGKRKLAYVIKKETRGHYHYFVYTGKNNVVQELERNLRIHEHVLRFLSVHLGDEFVPSKFVEARNNYHVSQKLREENSRRDDDYYGE